MKGRLGSGRCRSSARSDGSGRRPYEYIPVNWPPVTLMTWPWM